MIRGAPTVRGAPTEKSIGGAGEVGVARKGIAREAAIAHGLAAKLPLGAKGPALRCTSVLLDLTGQFPTFQKLLEDPGSLARR